MNEYLLWLDLETSGTDETKDKILEIAVVVTTPELEELASFETAVWPDGWDERPPDDIDPYVMKMHTDSHLWEDCASTGVPVTVAEAELILRLNMVGDRHEFILAGSGVSHFDRRFLAAQMPELVKWLKYYSIDAGVLRRTLGLIGRDDLVRPAPSKPHRAMADVRIHLDELRQLKQALARPDDLGDCPQHPGESGDH